MTSDDFDELQRLVETGEHQAARERLRVIEFYPLPSSLVEPLARLYWQLGYAEMAGRYWYLTNASGSDVEQAIAAFERAYGDHPQLIFDALLQERYWSSAASERFAKLEQRVDALSKRIAPRQTWRQWLTERILFFGCATVLFLAIMLMGAGAVAILSGFRR